MLSGESLFSKIVKKGMCGEEFSLNLSVPFNGSRPPFFTPLDVDGRGWGPLVEIHLIFSSGSSMLMEEVGVLWLGAKLFCFPIFRVLWVLMACPVSWRSTVLRCRLLTESHFSGPWITRLARPCLQKPEDHLRWRSQWSSWWKEGFELSMSSPAYTGSSTSE